MGIETVLARRRAERQALIERARRFAKDLNPRLNVRAVVVFGSVARGDFNVWSDIDVLVVADHLPERLLDRLQALEPRPGGIQPVAWTPAEWHTYLKKGNPIAGEAVEKGVWLIGSADVLARARES